MYSSPNIIRVNEMCGVLLLLLFTAIEVSRRGNSPYTSTEK